MPKYTPGNKWTWSVTRQLIDPTTENVLSERTYEQTLEYIGEEVKNGVRCFILKLTREGVPGYGKIFRVMNGSEVREFGTESFDENGNKISDYTYSRPILLWSFPLRPGKSFSDIKGVRGYDNLAGIEAVESTELRLTEVLGEETLFIPAKVKTFRLRTYGSSWGEIRVVGVREGRTHHKKGSSSCYLP
jgi:hypothetical protein